MLKIFVEEAAALASITLFVGMIAIWAQDAHFAGPTRPTMVVPRPPRVYGESTAQAHIPSAVRLFNKGPPIWGIRVGG